LETSPGVSNRASGPRKLDVGAFTSAPLDVAHAKKGQTYEGVR